MTYHISMYLLLLARFDDNLYVNFSFYYQSSSEAPFFFLFYLSLIYNPQPYLIYSFILPSELAAKFDSPGWCVTEADNQTQYGHLSMNVIILFSIIRYIIVMLLLRHCVEDN